MNTLIAISLLGILCLLLEVFNLRKAIVPVTAVGLAATLVYTISLLGTNTSHYNNMVVTNKFTIGFSSLFIVLTLFLVLLSADFYQKTAHKIADYVSIKIFLLAGGIAMVSFGNMAMFFLGLEILSISLYILAGSNPLSLKSNEAGMKYFIMGSFASAVILFGIALVYGAIGSFDVNQIYEASHSASTVDWFYIGASMISVGMLFKIAAVPFHFWAPDVYEGAPALTTATMSTLAKVVAIAAFFKLNRYLNGNMKEAYEVMLVVIAILSMTVGNIMALKQYNVKRILAYSGISHAGFMLVSLLNVNLYAPTLFYYTIAYATAGMAAFAVVIYVCKDKENEDIEHFRGFGKQNPVLGAVLTAALLSMGGIPIFSGFFAKFFIFNEALHSHYTVLVVFGILNSIIAIGYYFRIIGTLFSGQSVTENKKIPLVYYLVALGAIAINIGIGILPSIITG
ncbi:MAG: NADH-quinone oxidoreductase subunit N [Flavobacterium sp.]|nr:NADH-quinone oxidoreductase subunit N [Candidatus Neoflavobacterium equi]